MQPNPFASLPVSVLIDGISVPIDFDFRVGVAMERECLSEGEPDVGSLLTLFYKGDIPQNVEAAVKQMVWFFQVPNTMEEADEETQKKGGQWYDFQQDMDVLLASFLFAYGIDLSTARIHWWTFRRLMLNLPADCYFMERVKYRTIPLNKVPKAQRAHYKKMKAMYAIKTKKEPKYKTIAERDAAYLADVRKRYEEAAAYGKTES